MELTQLPRQPQALNAPLRPSIPTQSTSERRLRRRLFVWSLMVAAIAWTLIYQRAQKVGAVPEFVYANF